MRVLLLLIIIRIIQEGIGIKILRSYCRGSSESVVNSIKLKGMVSAKAGNTFVWTEEGVRYTTGFSEHLKEIRKVDAFVKEVTIRDGIHYLPDFWVTKGWVIEKGLLQESTSSYNLLVDYINSCSHFLLCTSHGKYVYISSRGNFSKTYDSSKAYVFKSFMELKPHLTSMCKLITSKYVIHLHKPSLYDSDLVDYQGISLYMVRV